MKAKSGLKVAGKLTLLVACLYFFICSLSFLSDSFRMVGGRSLGAFFKNSDLLNNPIVGVMIGVLVTVLVQSSSTSTSIIVGLVAANVPVKTAIPMILGANIGTSVTNTIVSFTQMQDRDEFRRAFACATVHDMFNWLTVIIMVIVESATGFLETITAAMVASLGDTSGNQKPPDFLKVLTNPFTKAIVKLDKKVLKGWAVNDPKYSEANITIIKSCKEDDSCFLFNMLGPQGADIGDTGAGVILLVISLFMLCGCLMGMVKLLNSLLGEKVKEAIKDGVNKDIPIKGLGWLTGYLAMLVGAILTVLVQSSSVFTSTLTPLAGAGLVSLERAYPLTLGSNIGTTSTSLLAAMAAGGAHAQDSVQIALVHLMFNIIGIAIFYPVPFMRWPISLAQTLGETTAKYRWFALVYLFGMFLVFPGFIFLLSLAGPIVIYVVFVPIAALLLLITIVNLLQKKRPKLLPAKLQNWEFLPEPVRSLDPVDRMIVSCLTRWRTHKQGDIESDRWGGGSCDKGATRWEGGEGAKTNKAFEADQTPV